MVSHGVQPGNSGLLDWQQTLLGLAVKTGLATLAPHEKFRERWEIRLGQSAKRDTVIRYLKVSSKIIYTNSHVFVVPSIKQSQVIITDNQLTKNISFFITIPFRLGVEETPTYK